MTAEQATALLVALTGLVAALGAAVVQVRGLRRDLNGRVTELLSEATSAAHKHGELEGRDFMRRLMTGAGSTERAEHPINHGRDADPK